MNKVKCIMLVDDDETTNIINEMLITDMGITEQILQASNGKEGIDLLKRYVLEQHNCLPGLILLDINMPVMDGFQFLEAYKQLDFPGKSSIAIVMLTTSMNPGDVVRLQKAPIKGVINKPLTEEKVQDLLRQHF